MEERPMEIFFPDAHQCLTSGHHQLSQCRTLTPQMRIPVLCNVCYGRMVVVTCVQVQILQPVYPATGKGVDVVNAGKLRVVFPYAGLVAAFASERVVHPASQSFV